MKDRKALVAAKPFSMNGVHFLVGDEFDPEYFRMNRIKLASRISGGKIWYGVPKRSLEDVVGARGQKISAQKDHAEPDLATESAPEAPPVDEQSQAEEIAEPETEAESVEFSREHMEERYRELGGRVKPTWTDEELAGKIKDKES